MVTQGVGEPIRVSSTVKALHSIIAFFIIGILCLSSCLQLIMSAYLALINFEEYGDPSKDVETSYLNAENLATLQLQFDSQNNEVIVIHSYEPHTTAELADPARYDQQEEDAVEVQSASTTACTDFDSIHTTEPTLPDPLPTSGLGWFDLITSSVFYERPVFTVRREPFEAWLSRTLQWVEVYDLFDFSAPVIDMELDVEQQPLDIQIYFTYIGMVFLLDRNYREDDYYDSEKRAEEVFLDWQETTDARKREFLTVGAQLLREGLANGTAFKVDFDEPESSEPFPWFDDALTHMPNGWMWENPEWGSYFMYDEDGTLEQCPVRHVDAPSVTDKMLLRGSVILSNVRLPLPTLRPGVDIQYVFRAVYFAYSPGCHPLTYLEDAKTEIESMWQVPILTKEYDALLRSYLLFLFCRKQRLRFVDSGGTVWSR